VKKQSQAEMERQRRKWQYVKRRLHKSFVNQRRLRNRRVRKEREQYIKPRNVRAPDQVRLQGDPQPFLLFVTRVTTLLHAGIRVRLDFRHVKRLYPCGMLLLMAEVRRWLKAFPDQMLATYPEDEVVEQMLQRVDLIGALGLAPRKVISHDDVVRWFYFTGTRVELVSVEPFMERVREFVAAEAQTFLFDCVSEAVTNVRHHAYGEAGADSAPWWMFATISSERITVAVHDRGASIPATIMEKPTIREQIKKLFAKNPQELDARMIDAATGGRSRTKLVYRGKGLPEMLEFTRAVPGSSLDIYSRWGGFHQHASSATATVWTLSTPVPGTLLLWTLSLES
jgi:hypothetical protein